MDVTEVSILHHVGIILLGLWFLSAFNWCHPFAYLVALGYLFLVHERYVTRLRKKLEHEEWKQANQRRVLSDSETVRWLNHAVENIWPICMEQIASQKILLPIIPWFLEKYKPWTAKEAEVQHLYLGRNPPLFTEMRVLRQSSDDHLVLELGMNFLTADDMSAILAVKLRKRLGFGMVAKLHITGMHVEGKVLVGVRFLQHWPYLGRLRVCFVEPPYFQMTVKPIFSHGLDVTELPGIAGWLDKLLSIAFEQTLVEPNMMVVDVEKFVSPEPESWFRVDEKDPVAYAKVEIIEASDMKPSDLNGLADPYVNGHLGAYRFKTKIERKTLNPKWHEEFKIPILAWEYPNTLTIEVRDKDHFYDDNLGDYSVDISDFRDGQRHDMWVPLQKIKMGRLHLAITIIEGGEKGVDPTCDEEIVNMEERRNSFANETANRSSFASVSSEKSPKVEDNYEPIDVDGQKGTGIWVHHPGSEVSHTWKPRKGKSRRLSNEIHREPNDSFGSHNSTVYGSSNNGSSSPDDNPEDKHRQKAVMRGLHKIGAVFHKIHKKEDQLDSNREDLHSPHVNIREVNDKGIGVKFIMEDDISGFPTGKVEVEGNDGGGSDSINKGHVRDKAKNILKHAEKSLKHVLSRKSGKSKGDSPRVSERKSDTSDDESRSVQSPRDGRIPLVSQAMATSTNDSCNSEANVVQAVSSNTFVNNEAPVKVHSPDSSGEESIKSIEPKLNEEEMVADESVEPKLDKEKIVPDKSDNTNLST